MNPRPHSITVSPWKRSRFFAVHAGLELVCVCVYKKGAEHVAQLVRDLDNLASAGPAGLFDHAAQALRDHAARTVEVAGDETPAANADAIDHGTACSNCGEATDEPDEPFCVQCLMDYPVELLRANRLEQIEIAEAASAPIDAGPFPTDPITAAMDREGFKP